MAVVKKNFGLLPLVDRTALQLIELCAKENLSIRITQGLRTFAQQNALYNQPWDKKDNDGDRRVDESDEKVTTLKGGDSLHNYGVAFDICFTGKDPYPTDSRKWKRVGALGKSIGLTWGGDFKTFIDRPHFELTLGYKINDFKGGQVDYSRFF